MIRSSFNFWSNVACTAQHAATTANTRADEWNDKKGRQGVMITRAGWSRENAILSDQRGGKDHEWTNTQQATTHKTRSREQNKGAKSRERRGEIICVCACVCGHSKQKQKLVSSTTERRTSKQGQKIRCSAMSRTKNNDK